MWCDNSNRMCKGGSTLKVSVLRWLSKRVQRVVVSSTSGETLAVNRARDLGVGVANKLIYLLAVGEIPIVLLTDSNNLFQNVYSDNPRCNEEELIADLFILRESCSPSFRLDAVNYNGHTTDLWWCQTNSMIADSLTKPNAKGEEALLKLLETNTLDLGKLGLEWKLPRQPTFPFV